MVLLDAWSGVRCPVVGMVHLPPLAGSPRYGGDFGQVKAAALSDAENLVAGGVHGLLLENFNDAPFFPRRVPATVVAQMTAVAVELRRRFDVPLGINVLRNDGLAALSVAHAAGAHFVRVNVLTGARLTDQGVIQGIAHRLLRQRARLSAGEVKILADVDVKHSAPLAARPPADEARDAVQRGGADALVVSGSATGSPVDPSELENIKSALPDTPVFVGSGVTADNARELARQAAGLIVGTALKRDGAVANAVDRARVTELLARLG